ncbi:MAG TPA: GNAT family N-acetyltransferase [Chthoniobacterales bacterium]|nr:GNAT family N-acetyltransferase [Chthoniobacterales bacterium]
MTIRSANADDAERLAELSEVLGYPVEPGVIRRTLERLLAKPDHVVFVAEVPPPLVAGWIHAAEQDILEVGRSGEILGLVVAPDRRGEGIGRRLVERVERWAAERGLERVSVRSNVTRVESHPFYERNGYVRVKTQHAYRKSIRSRLMAP